MGRVTELSLVVPLYDEEPNVAKVWFESETRSHARSGSDQ